MAALLVGVFLPAVALAQIPNPVYVDVSPVARDALVRAREMAAGGNLPQAVRELQKLLDEHADRVAPVAGEPDLFRSVRSQVHAALLDSPELLAQYLGAENARARELLDQGSLAAARRVESTRLLTEAGFEAVLRVSQALLESACFEAARLSLEQLEVHPVRRLPEAGREAAELLARVARYVDDDEVKERAARWAREAGAPAPEATPRAERPPAALVRVTDIFTPAPAIDASSVPGRPLWSSPVEPPGLAEPVADPRLVGLGKDPESLWVLPTIASDTLYLNDGTFLTARDRFTLQLKWSVEPGSGQPEEMRWSGREQSMMRGASRTIEDTNSVTLAGRIVLATTGVAHDGSRDGDARTHALDADTGRIIWSVHVPGLDPQLESGSVRGPVLVDGDTVVVAVRKSAMARRIVSVYLVGLELRTGALKWVRLIASAGALPFNRERRISDACTLDRGVVYVCDQLGAAGAVEAASGRPLWVRRMPVAGVAETSFPWRWSSPVVHGATVLMLNPDHRELLGLERRGGEILARRPAGALGEPDYIVAAGPFLGAVGDSRVAILPLDDIEHGAVTLTRAIADPGIRARVVVAGERLLVPRADGISVVDPARPTESQDLRLEAMGTPLPVENQLLAIDSRDVHSYLAWPVAQSLLRERMARDPANPEPACTYAELAYRAEKPEEVPAAADQALSAIDRDPATHAPVRARLFEVLREMVDASQERWVRGAAFDPRAPVLDQAVLAAVIERLGRAAATPEDRLTHLMALGRLREAELTPARAVEAYQRVLADTALAGAAWRGPGVRVRGEIESAARIRRILVEHGAGVYQAFDAESAIAVEALGGSPAAEALEALARRYPGAAGNAALWLRVSEQRERAGDELAGVEALREGLAAAQLARQAGRPVPAASEAELAGRLITELLARDRVFTASRLVSTLRAERPELVPTNRSTPLDTAALMGELTTKLAALQRLPRVGPALGAETQTLDGWSIMTPVSRGATPCEHIMLASLKESRVALWGIPGAAGGSASGRAEYLSLLWLREHTGPAPRLLRVDHDSVYLLWDGGEHGPSVERIDAVTGQTRWKTDPLRSLFAAEPGHRERLELDAVTFETPVDGACEARDTMWAMDAQAMVLAERIGRVAVFDPQTGRLLWKQVSPISRVHDLDVSGGVVAIGGAVAPEANPAAIAGLMSTARVHQARTGALVRSFDGLSTPLAWLRLAPLSGAAGPGGVSLILATGGEIQAVDAESGNTAWSIPGGPAFDSIDAWIFGDRMFVLTRDRDLWIVSLSGGRSGDAALETFGRLADAWPIETAEIPVGDGPSRVAFLSRRGVLVFDAGKTGPPPEARLVGIDALTRPTGPGAFPDAVSDQDLVPPVPCRGAFVTMETWQTRLPDGRPAYAMHLLDSATGKLTGPTHNLVLWDSPRRLAVLDGRVLVTAGGTSPVTVVYSAPEVEARR